MPRNGKTAIGDAALTLQVLDALQIACALYREDGGSLLHATSSFSSEFSSLGPIDTRSSFESHFENFDGANVIGVRSTRNASESGKSEVYAPQSGCWYALHWTNVDWIFDERCILVFANNTTEHMEALRRRQKQQEKLLFTSRMMSVGEMATTVAHELNQPLAAIINCLNVSMSQMKRFDEPDRVVKALQLAHAQAEYASDVVSHLRDFVRSRAPKRSPHNLHALVSTVMPLLQVEAQKHHVRVLVELAADLPQVCVDRVMVEQVLLNLLKNGIEAMLGTELRRRQVSISARLALDSEIEVRVTDNGCGLSESDEQHLFSPFFTNKPNGLGVGLAICRSIIEYHDGRLIFERNPKGGSIFGFTLPTAPPVRESAL